MPVDSDPARDRLAPADLYRAVEKYAQPSLQKAIWQTLATFLPFAAVIASMIYTLHQGYSYLITLVLSILAGAFQVRTFIIFHDCCHGSFFASRRGNRILGYVSGILNFTPFEQWRRTHAEHHATVGDLDRRGVGDVWTITVDEFLAARKSKRFAYRVFRNPFVMFFVGPAVLFGIMHRFSRKGVSKKEHYSVLFTNLAILAVALAAIVTIGVRRYLLIQVPVALIAGATGVWLFYVQHQFEGVYWARHEAWDPMRAALEGSSYYRLPKILQWFTGSIGLHHIHHIQPRIPNYNLQQCYDEMAGLQAVEALTIRRSFSSMRMKLWDEKQGKLVSFRSLKVQVPLLS